MMTPTAPSQKEPEIKNTFEITPSLHIIPNRISDHGIERILSTIILYHFGTKVNQFTAVIL